MSLKRKILQITSGRDLNGVLTYCKFLAEHLVEDGYDITVMCRHDCWLRTQSIPGVRFFESPLNRRPSELREAADWIRDQQFDLIHTHMSRAHLFGIILRAITGVPSVATAHSCKFQLHWKLNDFVIANSEATLRFHRRVNWISSRASEAVYCFTDLDRFQDVAVSRVEAVRHQMKVGDDDYLIGIVGQVNPRKGQLYLFRALPQILAEVPHLKVALLGPYYDQTPYVQRLREFLSRHGISDRVMWMGPRDHVEDYMQAFDLCVVPSLNEPLGLVAVEALAASTPVIASNAGGLPEIISHEKTGLLVPRKNSKSLADAIVRLAHDWRLSQRLATTGREFVLERFEPQRLARQVETIYERVICGRPRRTAFWPQLGRGSATSSASAKPLRRTA